MKTSGFRCETKFGLLVFLGHPNIYSIYHVFWFWSGDDDGGRRVQRAVENSGKVQPARLEVINIILVAIIIMVTVMVVMSRKWWKTNKRLNILYLTLCWKSIIMQLSRLSNCPHSVGILAGTDGTGENEHLNRMNNLVGCLKNVSDDDDVVFDLSIEIFVAGMTW